MMPGLADKSSTRSGAEYSERKDVVTLPLLLCLIAVAGAATHIGWALNNIADSIKTLKPTITLHEHPKEVQVIHTGLPKVAGRAE